MEGGGDWGGVGWAFEEKLRHIVIIGRTEDAGYRGWYRGKSQRMERTEEEEKVERKLHTNLPGDLVGL